MSLICPERISIRRLAVSLLTMALGAHAVALAQPPVVALRYSFDTATVSGIFLYEDENVSQDDLAGALGFAWTGPLPEQADLTAYHLRQDGTQLFALDITVNFPGLPGVRPNDVVSFNGNGYGLAFSGVANGLPAGTAIDALTAASNEDLLLSFDVALDLASISAEDRDLLRWNGSGWSVFFDGSDAGVPDGLDLDAAHLLTDNVRLLLSFDGSGVIGGIQFDNEDVLEYNLVNSSWVLFWDGSGRRPEVATADLDALYAFEERPSGIFSDGFESGDLSAWSGSLP